MTRDDYRKRSVAIKRLADQSTTVLTMQRALAATSIKVR